MVPIGWPLRVVRSWNAGFWRVVPQDGWLGCVGHLLRGACVEIPGVADTDPTPFIACPVDDEASRAVLVTNWAIRHVVEQWVLGCDRGIAS